MPSSRPQHEIDKTQPRQKSPHNHCYHSDKYQRTTESYCQTGFAEINCAPPTQWRKNGHSQSEASSKKEGNIHVLINYLNASHEVSKSYKLQLVLGKILLRVYIYILTSKKMTWPLDRKHISMWITMNTRAISQPNNVCNVCQARLTGHAKVCLMMRGVNRLLPDMAWNGDPCVS